MKTIKRMEVLDKEVRSPVQPKHYLVGLSFGPASSSMLHILEENVQYQLKKRKSASYQLTIVHVDTSLTPPSPSDAGSEADLLLKRYQERYHRFSYECVNLSYVLELKTIDWSVLPSMETGAETEPREKLAGFFGRLPSLTSRADILRLFIRHILIAKAVEHSCTALLLGYSTTALAELTLGETAKGRGYSLPWQVNDGIFPIPHYPTDDEPPESGPNSRREPSTIAIYYPARDVFRKELVSYTALTDPPLSDLIPEGTENTGSVVSHKELSIEDVMARYFEDVEANYPSVVANVARTTGKLDRPHGGDRCRLCGTVLDEQGDERWKGEIGDDGGSATGKLCYGCDRSINS